MTSIRIGQRLRPSWVIRSHCLHGAVGLALLGAMLSGCAPKSEVPTGDAAERIRQLALGYVQYAASNRGTGPADEEALIKSIAQRNQMTPEEVKPLFTSPRDGQPYVIRWGMRPMIPDPTGVQGPTPNIIIYENTGADGTRIVADGRMSIREMSDEEFTAAVPDHASSGR